MVQKAVQVGSAMTGGQDRAAAVRRIALAAAVRSEPGLPAIRSTATPRLTAGACSTPRSASCIQRRPRSGCKHLIPRARR